MAVPSSFRLAPALDLRSFVAPYVSLYLGLLNFELPFRGNLSEGSVLFAEYFLSTTVGALVPKPVHSWITIERACELGRVVGANVRPLLRLFTSAPSDIAKIVEGSCGSSATAQHDDSPNAVRAALLNRYRPDDAMFG